VASHVGGGPLDQISPSIDLFKKSKSFSQRFDPPGSIFEESLRLTLIDADVPKGQFFAVVRLTHPVLRFFLE
jgi:hypothetical protein